jgi:hypothetical protein
MWVMRAGWRSIHVALHRAILLSRQYLVRCKALMYAVCPASWQAHAVKLETKCRKQGRKRPSLPALVAGPVHSSLHCAVPPSCTFMYAVCPASRQAHAVNRTNTTGRNQMHGRPGWPAPVAGPVQSCAVPPSCTFTFTGSHAQGRGRVQGRPGKAEVGVDRRSTLLSTPEQR